MNPSKFRGVLVVLTIKFNILTLAVNKSMANSVVVKYAIFARPGIKSYKDGFCLKISIQVF